MIFGISYGVWVAILVLSAFAVLVMSNSKSPSRRMALKVPDEKELDDYVKSITALNQMRWFKLTAKSEDVPVVLNKIEVVGFTVMYQFFLNQETHLYDLFFRCKREQLEELKVIMKDFITIKNNTT